MTALDRAGPDARLVPAATTAWATAWWATGAGPTQVLTAAGVAASFGLVCGAVVVRHPATQRLYRVAVLLLVPAVVAGTVLALTGLRLGQRSADPVTGWAGERAAVAVLARVSTDPQRTAPPVTGPGRPATDRWLVRLSVQQVTARGRTVPSAVDVVLLGGDRTWSHVVVGSTVRATGRLAPGRSGDRAVALLIANGPPRTLHPGAAPWRVAETLRAGLRRACRGLPADAAGLLPALVVGDTSGLDDGLRDDLRTAGLTHLTAVSGGNVSIVAAAVVLGLALVGAGRRVRFAGALLAVAGFVVLARPEPSVLRAAVMGALTLAGVLLSRRGVGVPVLSAAVVVLVTGDPWLSRSFGFCLSVLATGALVVLVPSWLARRSGPAEAGPAKEGPAGPVRLRTWAAAALAVPVAAQVVTAPVVLLLSPGLSLTAVPANLLAAPAVVPATVCGVLAAAISPLAPGPAHLAAIPGGWATWWIAQVARVAADVPGGTLAWPGGPGGAALLTAVTVPGVLLVAWARRPLPVGCCYLIAVLLPAAMLGGGLPVGWLPGHGVPEDWAVGQCDVGQGSATMIRTGPARALLVDTGPDPDAVDRCLRRGGVRVLDLVLLTHFHADHVDGLSGAVRGRGRPPVLVSPLPQPAGRWQQVGRDAARIGQVPVPVTAPLAGRAGTGADAVDWLAVPPRPQPVAEVESEDVEGTVVNDASVALVVRVAGLQVVALGDLEPLGQQALARRLPDLVPSLRERRADVVVVAHHGSGRQDENLYRLLRPRLALIGVGANDYGHPAPSTLDLLRRVGAVVARTDVQGAVTVGPARGRLVIASSR